MLQYLRNGYTTAKIELPGKTEILQPLNPEFIITRKTFEEDFTTCLTTVTHSFKNIAIVVSDKTRLSDYSLYLPWLTYILNKYGAGKKNITFYIAYGIHPVQSEQESLLCYGSTYKEYPFIHHNSLDQNLFKVIGSTMRGSSIEIRRDILDSSLIITFGAISYHYFAGYGGGRKHLFPGLGMYNAINHNHSLYLDIKARGLATGCRPGNLEGNPVADDLKEFDSYMPAKISIHAIPDLNGKVCQLIIGKTYDDFILACETYDQYYRVPGNKKYDLVIASAGGYPKDINFIQAHKSLQHAGEFVKDGGNLVLFADCIDGLGNENFIKYFKAGRFDVIFDELVHNYIGNGGTALSMMKKTSRIHIYMITSLDESICNTLNVRKINQNELNNFMQKVPGSIAVMPNASMIIAGQSI